METYALILALVVFVPSIFLYDNVRRIWGQTQGHSLPPKVTHLDPFFSFDYVLKVFSDVKNYDTYFKKYGKTFRHNWLFGPTVIGTCDANNMFTILAGKDWGNCWRQASMKHLAGGGLLNSDGEAWKKSKSMMKPAFNKEKIANLGYLEKSIDRLIEEIPTDGKTIDLQPKLFELWGLSSLYFVFGLDSQAPDPDLPITIDAFFPLWKKSLIGVGVGMMLGKFAKVIPRKSYIRTCARVHSFVDFFITKFSEPETSDSPEDSSKTVARTFLKQSDDKKYIRDQLIQAMLGAQDTTSTLAANAVEFLAENPSSWKELRREVADKGSELLAFDALRNNDIIQNILKETLRLRPVFAVIKRVALRDTHLATGGGPNGDMPIFVPRGTLADPNFYSLHRDPEVFGPDADSFNPHRWDIIKPGVREFVPFGIGGRSCLGKDKALGEAAYLLVRLATEFEKLESRNKNGYKGAMEVSVKNAHGCKVAFSGRVNRV